MTSCRSSYFVGRGGSTCDDFTRTVGCAAVHAPCALGRPIAHDLARTQSPTGRRVFFRDYYRALSLMRQPTAPSTMLDGEGFRPTRLAIKENARSSYATREDDSRAPRRTTHYIRPLKILIAAPL